MLHVFFFFYAEHNVMHACYRFAMGSVVCDIAFCCCSSYRKKEDVPHTSYWNMWQRYGNFIPLSDLQLSLAAGVDRGWFEII